MQITETTLPSPSWFIGPQSEWFWAMLQFLTVAASLYLIYKQIRIQSQANMLTALFELSTKWNTPHMLESRHHVSDSSLRGLKDHAINQHEERIGSFFEEIGFFLRQGAFSPEAIWEQYSYYVEHYWPMLEPHVREFRKTERDDTWFEQFESLYNRMQKIAKKRGVYVIWRDRADLEKFARGELYTVAEQRVVRPSASAE